MENLRRRRFLQSALFGGGAIGLRSILTGLPPAFLASGRSAWAQEAIEPHFLILSSGAAGHPLNTNVPGTYPMNPEDGNDPIRLIEHPQVSELGRNNRGSVGDQAFTASAFETPSELRLGAIVTRAAGPWSALPIALRRRLAFIHHATYSSAHPEFNNVMEFHGAVRGPDGTGREMFASFVAQENASALGTLMNQPVNVGANSLTFEGRPINKLRPDNLRSLFANRGHPTRIDDPSQIVRLRDQAIDRVYRDVRQTGTRRQRAFLDRYALARTQAAELGDSLVPLLTEVRGESPMDQVTTAIALIRLKVTPVVMLQLPYGGDNHQDGNLADEVGETLASIDVINTLWERLTASGLEDRVTFAHLDVFGRRLRRNSNRGRNHNRDHHVMMTFGPRTAPGVYGGLEPYFRSNGRLEDFRATSLTPSIPREQSLEAAGKTLATCVGVPAERVERRIAGGAVIPSAVLS